MVVLTSEPPPKCAADVIPGSIATSINSAGLIVGVYGNLANETHGFADAVRYQE